MSNETIKSSVNKSNNGSNDKISSPKHFSTCNHCFGRRIKNSKHQEKEVQVEELKNNVGVCVKTVSDLMEADPVYETDDRTSILRAGPNDLKRRFSISPTKSTISRESVVSPLVSKVGRTNRVVRTVNRSNFEKTKTNEMLNLNNAQSLQFSKQKFSNEMPMKQFRWSLAPANFMESMYDIDCSMGCKWKSLKDLLKTRINNEIKYSCSSDIVTSKLSYKLDTQMDTQTINVSNNDVEAFEIFVQNFKEMKNQNRFVFKNYLGEGAFGKVIECVDLKRKRLSVAIKISKRIFHGGDADIHEVNILKEIQEKDTSQSNHCGTLLQVLKIENRPCLIFKRYGDNLYSVMKKRNFEPLPRGMIFRIAHQLFHACSFLHDICQIIHTDLKPENIVLSSPVYISKEERGAKSNILPSKLDIKIIDFGSAVSKRQTKYKRGIGTRHYRSLEVILGQEWDEKVDNWSVGCILYELYTGQVLFEAKNDILHLAMIEKIIGPIQPKMLEKCKMAHVFTEDGRIDGNTFDECHLIDQMSAIMFHFKQPSHQTKLFTNIITSCLKVNPEERPHFKDILQSPFFQQFPDGIRKRHKLF